MKNLTSVDEALITFLNRIISGKELLKVESFLLPYGGIPSHVIVKALPWKETYPMRDSLGTAFLLREYDSLLHLRDKFAIIDTVIRN